MHGLFIDCAQAVVEPPVLVGLVLDFLQQAMAVNADADVARQRADDLQIFFSEFFAGRLFTQEARHQSTVRGQPAAPVDRFRRRQTRLDDLREIVPLL